MENSKNFFEFLKEDFTEDETSKLSIHLRNYTQLYNESQSKIVIRENQGSAFYKKIRIHDFYFYKMPSKIMKYE